MKEHSPRFLEIAEDARTRIREVEARTVLERLERGDRFHLVDVREESEWAAGRLPGALHLSKGIIERDIETTIPDFDAEIVVYCGGGYRSAMVADNLQRMGYTRVRSMIGGYRGWVEADHPTRTD